MLPVIVINGPLGSGKTTLIHELLKSHVKAKTTLWLKTEFGEKSVDEYILLDTGVKTQSLTGGCICHVLLSELDDMLTQIEAIDGIERVIIETSGMSHPAPVTQTIERHAAFIVAQAILVVDTKHAYEESYPKPEILAGGAYIPYDLILFNKYNASMTPGEEAALEKTLDPWFDGVYADIEKLRLPSKKEFQQEFENGMGEWAARLIAAMQKAIESSSRSVQDAEAAAKHHDHQREEAEHRHHHDGEKHEAEDHEGAMQTLVFHLSPDQLVSRQQVEAYAESAALKAVRIKGVFRTEHGWEFYNWARGSGEWSDLGSQPASQILLVIGHDVKEDASLRFEA